MKFSNFVRPQALRDPFVQYTVAGGYARCLTFKVTNYIRVYQLGRLDELVQSGLKSNTIKREFETSSLPANILNKGVRLLRRWENRCLGAVYLRPSVFFGGGWFLPLLGRRSLAVDCHGIHPDNEPPLQQHKRLSIVTQHNCPTLQFL